MVGAAGGPGRRRRAGRLPRPPGRAVRPPRVEPPRPTGSSRSVGHELRDRARHRDRRSWPSRPCWRCVGIGLAYALLRRRLPRAGARLRRGGARASCSWCRTSSASTSSTTSSSSARSAGCRRRSSSSSTACSSTRSWSSGVGGVVDVARAASPRSVPDRRRPALHGGVRHRRRRRWSTSSARPTSSGRPEGEGRRARPSTSTRAAAGRAVASAARVRVRLRRRRQARVTRAPSPEAQLHLRRAPGSYTIRGDGPATRAGAPATRAQAEGRRVR